MLVALPDRLMPVEKLPEMILRAVLVVPPTVTPVADEAITTPTEESVRRAMAIQLIINREWGIGKNENPNQGSFIIEEMTDLVEEAVLKEFEAISERGGVLGAMETGYQRGKIKEESMYYEHMKHDGTYPIVGVNTFLGRDGSPIQVVHEVMRSTDDEKQAQIDGLSECHRANAGAADQALPLPEDDHGRKPPESGKDEAPNPCGRERQASHHRSGGNARLQIRTEAPPRRRSNRRIPTAYRHAPVLMTPT